MIVYVKSLNDVKYRIFRIIFVFLGLVFVVSHFAQNAVDLVRRRRFEVSNLVLCELLDRIFLHF